MRSFELTSEENAVLEALERRLGHLYVTQRLGIEADHAADRKARHVFDLDNRYSARMIRAALQLTGLYARGRRNARSIETTPHDALIASLPPAFEGFTILQLSDLHIDMAADFVGVLIDAIGPLDYDLCVLTGDYRARTFGPHDAALAGMRAIATAYPHGRLCNSRQSRHDPPGPCNGVHGIQVSDQRACQDRARRRRTPSRRHRRCAFLSSRRLPSRGRGYSETRLFNSSLPHPRSLSTRGRCWLRSDAVRSYPWRSDLSSGGIPVLTEADSPRQFVRGAWRYHDMLGYTSVGAGTCLVDVRLNCRPEVTLHRLRRLKPMEPAQNKPD